MSERIVKIAIALSLLCLIASAVFYVSSVGDSVESAAVTAPDKTKEPKAQKHRRGSEGDFDLDDARGADSTAPVDSALDISVPGYDGDYVEEELATEGIVAGSVFLEGKGAAFEDVTVYLVQTKAYEVPPLDEGGELLEEEAVADEVSEEMASEEPPAEDEGELSEEQPVDEGEGPYAEDSYEYQEPIYLDENGEFEHYLAPGEYKLVARAVGHTPVAIEGISVRAGEEVRGLVVELQEGLKIAGYIRTSEPDVESLEGFEVTLEGEGYRQMRYTDADGAFEFDGLPKGTFKVSAFDTLTGKAEKLARAGETTVALDMLFHEITGTVVDEMGAPVADLEVIGRGKYQMSPTIDRDPFGATDGLEDPVAEELAAMEEQYAITDEAGRFTMRMAHDGPVSLSVQEYGDGSSAFARDVASDARGVQLRLSRGHQLQVRVLKLPEGLTSTAVDLTPEDEESSPFYVQSQSSKGGTLTFNVPAGVSWLLSHDSRAQIEIVGALPSNVKMGPLFQRGGRGKNVIALIKQQANVEEPQFKGGQADIGDW